MARRSRSRSTRDGNHIANRRLRSPTYTRLAFPKLFTFQDFRRWIPELLDDRYPELFPRAQLRAVKKVHKRIRRARRMAMPQLYVPVPTGMGFSEPARVVLCARRAIRKEVMHALGKSGRGGQRSPRITPNSLIHC